MKGFAEYSDITVSMAGRTPSQVCRVTSADYRRPWTLRRRPGLSATSLRPGQAGRDRA